MKMALFLCLGLMLASCASLPSPEVRLRYADAIAAQRGWQRASIATGSFELIAYWPATQDYGADLTIYIEGDGFAWLTPSVPSNDPTPLDPLALKLALAQPYGNVAYLARPCQFIDAQAGGCPQRFWTEQRFAEDVIDSSDKAVDAVKARFHARHLTLVGYSGGAAVAALLASRRNDVVKLITVAGNLDIRAWADYHHLQPLNGSLNPADVTDNLKGVMQWHFAGGKDKVVPASLTFSFSARFPADHRPKVIVEPSFDHHCCWAENWPSLMDQVH